MARESIDNFQFTLVGDKVKKFAGLIRVMCICVLLSVSGKELESRPVEEPAPAPSILSGPDYEEMVLTCSSF